MSFYSGEATKQLQDFQDGNHFSHVWFSQYDHIQAMHNRIVKNYVRI